MILILKERHYKNQYRGSTYNTADKYQHIANNAAYRVRGVCGGVKKTELFKQQSKDKECRHKGYQQDYRNLLDPDIGKKLTHGT